MMVAEPLLHNHLSLDSGPASATRGAGGACITRCNVGGTRPPPNTRKVMWGLEPRPEHQFMVAEPLLLPPSCVYVVFMSWETQPRAACMPHGQHTPLTACNDIFFRS